MKADSRFGLPAFAIDLLHDARLQNWRLLEVVILLNPVQILLRGFLPCGFTRNQTVVSPDAFGNTKAPHVVFENTSTEIEEYAITGPLSRTVSAVQPPRSVHVGLKLSF